MQNKRGNVAVIVVIVIVVAIASVAIYFVTSKKTTSSSAIGPDVVQQQTPTSAPQQSEIDASNINTKEGYLKTKDLVKDQEGMNLKFITLDNYGVDFANKIQYVFANSKITVATTYDLSTKEVAILDKADLTPDVIAGSQFLKSGYPVIPDSVISFGIEGALNAIGNNDDFKNLKPKYPEVFAKCISGTNFDEKYGWEISTVCSNKYGEDRKTIRFLVKPGDQQAKVLSNNLIN